MIIIIIIIVILFFTVCQGPERVLLDFRCRDEGADSLQLGPDQKCPQLFRQVAIILGRDGHLRYFLIFSIVINDLFAFFITLITYFFTSPI